MRFLAILPAVCALAAFIMSFLCLFAGHKEGFMEDYSLITVNTSSIGQGYVEKLLHDDSDDSDDSEGSGGFLSNLWHNITDHVGESIESLLDSGLESASEALGIDQFYSAHMMNYCEGDYTPASKPNLTLTSSDIHQNTTNCSTPAALFHFDPRASIERKLNESGFDVSLKDLGWPDEIDDATETIRTAYRAVFVLYCLAIAFIFLSLLASVVGVFSMSRLTALANIALAGLGFLSIGLASAIVTSVIEIGGNAINKYGERVSIEAYKGKKFLALTWADAGLMFVALVAWVVALFAARKHTRTKSKV